MRHPVVGVGRRSEGGGSGGGDRGVDLAPFAGVGLTAGVLESILDEHEKRVVPRCERLWGYYRNEERVRVTQRGDVVREPWQAMGLPPRLRHRFDSTDDRADRPAAVIENDIAWRVDALLDMAFGSPASVQAAGVGTERASAIESVIATVLEASGGASLVREGSLLGAVHGWVDFVVRMDAAAARVRELGVAAARERIDEIARLVRIEAVEPRRGVPLVSPEDYRDLDAYVIRTRAPLAGGGEREILEVLSGTRRRVWVDGSLRADAAVLTGGLPVVHVQHSPQPFSYAGIGEVEPLVGIQDELNTRLSDRAHRVTMQSFNMYLAKGLDGVSDLPVGPGRVWVTDNPEASVHAFGGDGDSPSEAKHVEELREAMDKASGVSPVVLGVVRARIGNLSSANALRITLFGVLTKTAQRRRSYGRGLARCAELVLGGLHALGVMETEPGERRVVLSWPDPLPTTEEERLRVARARLELGAEREDVLRALGAERGVEDAAIVERSADGQG